MKESPTNFRGVAVDIGNSAVHVGLFDGAVDPLIGPRQALVLDKPSLDFERMRPLIESLVTKDVPWYIASVSDRSRRDLESWLDENIPAHRRQLLTYTDFPFTIDVEQPQRVGIDRLMAVAAARALCAMTESAIVIDAGTAITVDCWAGDAFRGGAILPGMRMSAAALDRYTQKLPLVATDALAAPSAIGRHTEAAIASGIFWGTVGAIDELIQRMSTDLPGDPRVFITGGDGRRLADHLDIAAYIPHLVLSGIALTAAHCEASDDAD